MVLKLDISHYVTLYFDTIKRKNILSSGLINQTLLTKYKASSSLHEGMRLTGGITLQTLKIRTQMKCKYGDIQQPADVRTVDLKTHRVFCCQRIVHSSEADIDHSVDRCLRLRSFLKCFNYTYSRLMLRVCTFKVVYITLLFFRSNFRAGNQEIQKREKTSGLY